MKYTKVSKGFTLIELLVVVAIVGILAAVIISSVKSAKEKGTITAIKKEMQQLSILFNQEYSDTGSYNNLIYNNWISLYATCDTVPVSGSYASKYREICNSVFKKIGAGSTDYNWFVGDGTGSNGEKYSIMIRITPDGGTWYCLGSSGKTYTGGYNLSAPGCTYDP